MEARCTATETRGDAPVNIGPENVHLPNLACTNRRLCSEFSRCTAATLRESATASKGAQGDAPGGCAPTPTSHTLSVFPSKPVAVWYVKGQLGNLD